LKTLTYVSITVTDKRMGERLRHFPLGHRKVAVADRGYGHPAALALYRVRWQIEIAMKR
jgi:hypothetical protein